MYQLMFELLEPMKEALVQLENVAKDVLSLEAR